jgi:uncharacterized Fe-S cluster protein YjdI
MTHFRGPKNFFEKSTFFSSEKSAFLGKKIFFEKIEIFFFSKIWQNTTEVVRSGQKVFWVKKNFWGQKNFWVKKNFFEKISKISSG